MIHPAQLMITGISRQEPPIYVELPVIFPYEMKKKCCKKYKKKGKACKKCPRNHA